jgi:hypothetical protein
MRQGRIYYYDPTVAAGRGVNTIVGPEWVAKHGIPKGATLMCVEGPGSRWGPIPADAPRAAAKAKGGGR